MVFRMKDADVTTEKPINTSVFISKPSSLSKQPHTATCGNDTSKRLTSCERGQDTGLVHKSKLRPRSVSAGQSFFRMSSMLLPLLLLSTATVCVNGRCPPGGTIHIAALLPVNHSRFPFAYQIVLPALGLAVTNVTGPRGPLQGCDIQVHFANSECSSAAAMNHMFNFYIQKQVDVFFGPCCDYAAAPVGRQLHYWQLPMLTAGAIARDFAAGKRMFFDLITRVGTSVNSLLDFLLEIMRQFHWKRIKQVYDPFAQDLVGDKVCHIMADGIHYGLQSQTVIPDIEQDYEKFEQVEHFLERMPEEIGDWAEFRRCVKVEVDDLGFRT